MEETHSKYLEVVMEDGFNFPLKHTTYNGKDYVSLKQGDVFQLQQGGIRFLNLDNGRGKFYVNRWLNINRAFIKANTNGDIFMDVTKKFNRNKSIDSILN